MGAILGTARTKHLNLNMGDEPTFGPMVGFPNIRPKREMWVCDEHLVSARIPPAFRDYCSHALLDYQVCRYKHFPFVYKCAHQKHVYLNCEQFDYVMRMKEFERERRLRERELRIKEKCAVKEPPPPPPPPPPKDPDCKK